MQIVVRLVLQKVERLRIDGLVFRVVLFADIKTDVEADLVQPCHEQGGVIELVDVLERVDVDLLHRVLRQIRVAQIVMTVVVDLVVCHRIQLGKRVRVIIPAGHDELRDIGVIRFLRFGHLQFLGLLVEAVV